MSAPVRTVVLCGGRGTRAHPATTELPKPMLPVAGRPVLEHLLEIYAGQGFTSFVLSTGYLSGVVRDWAATVGPARGWQLDVVDTGEDAGTAERIAGVADRLDGTFFATYGDGLGDVDLRALRHLHDAAVTDRATVATLTTVPLRSQYGTVAFGADGIVTGFREKPVLPDHWINAGFFVFELDALTRWSGTDLEGEVLPQIASEGRLAAYAHHGFWRSMDTQKDQQELDALAMGGDIPWLGSPATASSSPAPAAS